MNAKENNISEKNELTQLPSPGELAKREQKLKVTISLSTITIEFFKKEALKHGTKYQKLIRAVLDEYVKQHK
ncbi:MAG: CopG family transcriptional regulator [Candidatus Aegiribacteria sp.]